MKAREHCIGWRRILLLAYLFYSLFAGDAWAGSGIQHAANDKAWLGGGLYGDVAKDIHSWIIDTVPWRDLAGGKNHRVQWGHGLDWYYGTAPSSETLSALMVARGINADKAKALYWKKLPKQGGGRQRIVDRIRQSYPWLSREKAELMADVTFFSHISLDSTTKAGLPADARSKLEYIKKMFEHPSPQLMELAIELDAMKVKGGSIAERAAILVATPKNQERMAAIALTRADPGVTIANIQDKNYIGISKQGNEYLLCRSDIHRVRKILSRYPERKILVPSDVFAKCQNDPQMRALILAGSVVDEGTVVSSRATQSASSAALEKKAQTIYAEEEGYYAATRLQAMMAKISKNGRISAKAGAMAALFSSIPKMWKVAQGDMDIEDAVMQIAGDGMQAGVSQYVTIGLIQRLGDKKYALTALVNRSTTELLPTVTLSTAAKSVFLNYGVATFIFDETKTVYFLCSGSMDAEQFLAETTKSAARATGAGSASVCAVLLGANPAGFTVMAMNIGGYMLVSTAIDYADSVDSKNYVFIEDVLGQLPLEMQRRYTPSDLIINQTPWDIEPNQTPDSLRLNDDPSSLKLNNTPWD